jgi:hypothetical protein
MPSSHQKSDVDPRNLNSAILGQARIDLASRLLFQIKEARIWF